MCTQQPHVQFAPTSGWSIKRDSTFFSPSPCVVHHQQQPTIHESHQLVTNKHKQNTTSQLSVQKLVTHPDMNIITIAQEKATTFYLSQCKSEAEGGEIFTCSPETTPLQYCSFCQSWDYIRYCKKSGREVEGRRGRGENLSTESQHLLCGCSYRLVYQW